MFLHLWAGFSGDKSAAPFENWAPYVDAMARPGIAASSASYYRSAYRSAEEVRALIAQRKLSTPVLSVAGEMGIGARQKAFVEAFATNAVGFVVVPGAGHFLAEERPTELVQALDVFLRN